MKTSKTIILSLLVLFIYSCSNDSESDLTNGPDVIDNPDNPETAINYTDDIQQVMGSCVGCHGTPPVNGAPMSLVNFNQVSQRADGILNRMKRQSGSAGAMPPSGKLPQATIDKVDQWIKDGKLED